MSDQELQSRVGTSSEELINSLRKIVRPPGQRPSWMNSLNNRQLLEVYHRLQMGQSMLRVVKIAQKEWRIMPSSRSTSLCRAVAMFRDKAVGEIKKLAAAPDKGAREVSDRLAVRAAKIVDKVDALGTLGWLITVQVERIEMLHDREKATKLPFKQTDIVAKVLGELLGQYVSLQVQLGLVRSVPAELNLEVKHKFEGMLQGLGEDGARVADAIGRFLEFADANAVQMRFDQNTQTYVQVEKNGAPGLPAK